MRYFDYSFIKRLNVPVDLMEMVNAIYSIKEGERYNQKQFPDIFEKLKKIAIVQSVKSSNEIEGIITSDKRIKEIVNNNSAPLNHNEAEIAGYKLALDNIHRFYKETQFSEEFVLGLHKILLSQTPENNGGHYKTVDNVIREYHRDGTSRIRWEPTPAKDTADAMDQMFLAYRDATGGNYVNQLILIPCIVLDFLCIHPFSDGNGRTSRLLTLFLLYKAGFDVPKYISFEEQINKNKDAYYASLQESSYGWHENKNDYIPFVKFFLFTLFLCYKELDKRFLTVRDGKVNKNKRIEELLRESFFPMSKQEIQNLLPDVSLTTIERVLSTLLKEGKINKIGSTKSAKYMKSNTFKD